MGFDPQYRRLRTRLYRHCHWILRARIDSSAKKGRESDMKTGYNRRNAMAASIAICAALVLPASVNAQSGLTGNVMQRGVVRVAIAGGNAPYSSIDTDGEAIGYDVEIAKKFAASLKLKP